VNSALDDKLDRIRQRFEQFLSWKINDEIGGLLGEIRENRWEAYFFGGVPRLIVSGTEWQQPRDYDIVFADPDFVGFTKYAETLGGVKNRFGGYKLNIAGIEVDAWSLSDTWAFRKKHVQNVSFESLQKTVPFNVDSFLIEIFPQASGTKRNIYCDGFISAEESNTLDAILKENPFPPLCLVRAVHLAHSMQLNWSSDLVAWMADISKTTSWIELKEIQLSHYGHIKYGCDYWDRLEKHLSALVSNCSFTKFRPPSNDGTNEKYFSH